MNSILKTNWCITAIWNIPCLIPSFLVWGVSSDHLKICPVFDSFPKAFLQRPLKENPWATVMVIFGHYKFLLAQRMYDTKVDPNTNCRLQFLIRLTPVPAEGAVRSTSHRIAGTSDPFYALQSSLWERRRKKRREKRANPAFTIDVNTIEECTIAQKHVQCDHLTSLPPPNLKVWADGPEAGPARCWMEGSPDHTYFLLHSC